MGSGNGALNPTETRIFALLKDGKPHTHQEIHKCLLDEMQDLKHVNVHISNMRKKLAQQNLGILCDRTGQETTFRLARFM